ncbi:hypothetical protein Forpe1208_v003536 [Fusarium oxysporum f. sp. rapae]|uniref:Uncharacterized protein n=1 Tax=Fusarium oxysporum f. sp. rapae TaxID=485398 RepID=A0A8J5PG94_FUSOX|nr:hypothetical protein Forpe1208_v003536 [Fusarium oxysporum f. sp. rapae]
MVDSLAARRLSKVGAYVSGMAKEPAIQMTPEKIARNPMTQRQLAFMPMKPPQIGPKTGPRNGAAAKMAIAKPRWDAGNMSAMAPPAFVKGDEPKAPARNRKTSNDVPLGAAAQATLKMVRQA